MNRVCAIHNEYCPDGNCRWCEAPTATVDIDSSVWLKADVRILPVSGGHETFREVSYAELGWAPGGVTGSPL